MRQRPMGPEESFSRAHWLPIDTHRSATLLAPGDPLFYPPFKGPQLLRPIEDPDLHIEFPHFARLDMLQSTVFAVPSPPKYRAVARFYAGDISPLVEVLPLIDDWDFVAFEFPVETQFELFVE